MRRNVLIAVLAAMVGALVAAPVAVYASHQFTDVPDSNTFHDDIAWLADAGITRGCNPPANDEFCPKDEVTREQMAAFMRRFAEYIGAEDGTAFEMHWLIINQNATLGLTSAGLEDTQIFRPPSEPTGIYCVVFPDDVSIDKHGVMGAVEDGLGGLQDYGIAVNTAVGSACTASGSWDVTVTVTQSGADGPELFNGVVRLLIPPLR